MQFHEKSSREISSDMGYNSKSMEIYWLSRWSRYHEMSSQPMVQLYCGKAIKTVVVCSRYTIGNFKGKRAHVSGTMVQFTDIQQVSPTQFG